MRLSVDNSIALLSGSIAAWLERQAAARIEYLKAENRALRSRLSGRRIIFTDAERRTLATLAKGLGRKALRDLDPIVECCADHCVSTRSITIGNAIIRESAIGRFSRCPSRNILVELSILGIVSADS